MKILKRKKNQLRYDHDGYQISITARLTKSEAKSVCQSLNDYYYITPCHHSHDCCGCICNSHVFDIRHISARRVKATVNFYRNV